ncbi:MAG: hypothetical protein NZU63_07210 [Gemmataceae bacterium]|nr:hypothetical protein [Gemmataceae bacterium]MDW8242820.1 hypothetical protein [Thermogemmata sp.]
MFGLWRWRAVPENQPGCIVGLELNASMMRAVSLENNQIYPLRLTNDPAHTGTGAADDDLPLMIALHQKRPVVGWSALAVAYSKSYAMCEGFLPYLLTPHRWQHGHHSLSADEALTLVLEHVGRVLKKEAKVLAVAYPPYLQPDQRRYLTGLIRQVGLPLRGTVLAPLGVAHAVFSSPFPATPAPTGPDGHNGGLVPGRVQATPRTALVIDGDSYALWASVVTHEGPHVRHVDEAYAYWHQLGLRQWYEFLLNELADRFINQCRRDIRHFPTIQQSIFQQLLAQWDNLHNSAVRLVARAEDWHGEIELTPKEWDRFCRQLARAAAQAVAQVIQKMESSTPVRTVWLTTQIARLPGFHRYLQREIPPETSVQTLKQRAFAYAAAQLASYWSDSTKPFCWEKDIPLLPAPSH